METTYRTLLRDELRKRKVMNASYSSRAFARDLKISSGFVAQILNGARSLSEEKGREVAKKLKWPDSRTRIFVDLIRAERCQDQELRIQLIQRASSDLKSELRQIQLEQEKFQVISHWYHLAILELSALKRFRFSWRSVAKALSLTGLEARTAISRLVKTGLLQRKANGFQRAKNYKIGDVPSQAVRSFHKEHLKKAARAIEEQDFDDRDFSSITVATNEDGIKEAKRMIQEFRKKLLKTLEKGNAADRIYHAAFQLYRLDEMETNSEKGNQ